MNLQEQISRIQSMMGAIKELSETTDDVVGKEFWFEYHCFESPKSCDAELWYRTHNKVLVLSIVELGCGDTKLERLLEGCPRVYRVVFEDGFEYDVFEDELMESKEEFERPDAPKRNLQEQISRMKSMMGLNEISNPYKVDWEYPTQEYFTQELSELLGNPGRFNSQEFFNPDNYDTIYNIMSNTFKTIAEFVKGEEIENESEIKEILLNQNVTETIVSGEGEWDELKDILMNDPQCIEEGYKFFGLGEMKVWKGTDPETGEYVNNVDNTDYMGKITDFLWQKSPEKGVSSRVSQKLKDSGEEDPKRLAGNIDQYRDYARRGEERILPPAFVVKYFTQKEGNDYVLIGGFKRTSTALQMGIEPIKVWYIDITK